MAKFKATKFEHYYKREAFLVEYRPESLRIIREGLGIKRPELASLTGISASYIEDLERGQRQRPSQEILAKLGESLNVIFFT